MNTDIDFRKLKARATKVARQVSTAVQPVIPYINQGLISMVAFTAGLGIAQASGMGLRISCATPIAGPVGGVLGVGFASALAGQASLKYKQWEKDSRRNPLTYPGGLLHNVHPKDVLIDAALGIVMFKVMGGRYRSVMPSDLLKVGAIGKESLPAAGMQYATEEKRLELLRFFRRDGCHHCGTRRGPSIGDHMPPNRFVKDKIAALAKSSQTLQSLLRVPYVRQVAGALNLPTGPPRQRYFPQCQPCSQKQAAAVRRGRSVLVFHQLLHHGGTGTAWHYAGVLVGLRHNHHQSVASRR